MPYVSKSQQGKFHMLLKEGKIKASVVKEFDKESKGKHNLPEHKKMFTEMKKRGGMKDELD